MDIIVGGTENLMSMLDVNGDNKIDKNDKLDDLILKELEIKDSSGNLTDKAYTLEDIRQNHTEIAKRLKEIGTPVFGLNEKMDESGRNVKNYLQEKIGKCPLSKQEFKQIRSIKLPECANKTIKQENGMYYTFDSSGSVRYISEEDGITSTKQDDVYDKYDCSKVSKYIAIDENTMELCVVNRRGDVVEGAGEPENKVFSSITYSKNGKFLSAFVDGNRFNDKGKMTSSDWQFGMDDDPIQQVE